MNTRFLGLVCVSLALASCGISNNTTTGTVPETSKVIIEKTSPVVPTAKEEKMPTVVVNDIPATLAYTSAEVSMHATKDDCWLILDTGVYDVTSFIPSHPGGDKILRGCGKDATQMFAQHPDSAKAIKEKFRIGNLAK